VFVFICRKSGILLNSILVIIALILIGLSNTFDSYEMIITARFLIGLHSGINSCLVPLYLTEIAPIHLRGAFGSVYQLVVTISIVGNQALMSFESLLGAINRWPIYFAISIIVAMFQIVVLPLCPESPKHMLLNKRNELKALEALTWLRGTTEQQVNDDELDEIREENEGLQSQALSVIFKSLITNSCLRTPLCIASMIMIAQQLCGINAVLFFSRKIIT